MYAVIRAINENTDFFLLTLLRVSGLLISSPIFGRRGIPNMVKVLFCLTLTVMLFPLHPIPGPLDYTSVAGFLGLCALELLFGVAMSYVLNVFTMLVFTSGTLIDMQMGFGMVNVFDVQSNIQVPIMGNLLNLVMLIVFFAVNGHLKLIEILSATLTRIPVGHVALNTQLAMTALEVFVRAFVLAISVAMPMVASGLVLECALGIIVRTVPQVNVFVVGFPIKILVGFLVIMVCIPVFVELTDTIFNDMFKYIDLMFRGLGTA